MAAHSLPPQAFDVRVQAELQVPELSDRVAGSKDTVYSSRRLQIGTDQAWDAWTTSSGLQAWWWSDEPDVTYAVDPWAGGRYRIHSGSSGRGIRGTVLAAERPVRLLLQWRWLGGHLPSSEGLVQVTFAVDEDDVVVGLQETMRPGTSTRSCQLRWNTVLDALAQLEPHTIGTERR